MGRVLHEIVAGFFVVAALVGLPWGIERYQRGLVERPGTRVIELTGVKRDGVWTDEPVQGATYWRRRFRPAVITLGVGEEVVLRLNSADVTHGFYVPELGVGPVVVVPGHVVEVRLRGKRPGEFMYYCTAVCGECHHFMRGLIRVLGAQRRSATRDADGPRACPHQHAAPAGKGIVGRGAALFASKGCVACHGQAGRGGVRNPNYIKDTVPALDGLAEKMMLFEPEDAQVVIRLLEQGTDLHSVRDRPPFPTYGRFLAQYDAIRALIQNGNRAGKKDEAGPEPPLQMPSWRNDLGERDIDALVAYLVTLYRWDEDSP